jgi:hypothetical protein
MKRKIAGSLDLKKRVSPLHPLHQKCPRSLRYKKRQKIGTTILGNYSNENESAASRETSVDSYS